MSKHSASPKRPEQSPSAVRYCPYCGQPMRPRNGDEGDEEENGDAPPRPRDYVSMPFPPPRQFGAPMPSVSQHSKKPRMRHSHSVSPTTERIIVIGAILLMLVIWYLSSPH